MPVAQESISAAVVDHLCRVIETAPVCASPYAHFYLEQVFPIGIFKRMLELLPEPGAYTPDNPRIHTREDGRVTRSIFSLSAPGLARLTGESRSFWRDIADALSSATLRRAVFTKLSNDLARRFWVSADRIDSIEAYPKPSLVKDLGGYEIAPHRDTRSKIVTMQLYLPEDMSKSDLGTTVYRQRWLRLENFASLRNRFAAVKQFQFAPNSGYAFAVGAKSWHGREKLPMTSGERNSLMLIYYTTPDKGW